jgi:hypothetical protein
MINPREKCRRPILDVIAPLAFFPLSPPRGKAFFQDKSCVGKQYAPGFGIFPSGASQTDLLRNDRKTGAAERISTERTRFDNANKSQLG